MLQGQEPFLGDGSLEKLSLTFERGANSIEKCGRRLNVELESRKSGLLSWEYIWKLVVEAPSNLAFDGVFVRPV